MPITPADWTQGADLSQVELLTTHSIFRILNISTGSPSTMTGCHTFSQKAKPVGYLLLRVLWQEAGFFPGTSFPAINMEAHTHHASVLTKTQCVEYQKTLFMVSMACGLTLAAKKSTVVVSS